MKKFIACLFIAGVIGAGCRTTEPAQLNLGFTPDDTVLVNGLSCPLCAHNVDKQLLALAGVTKAQVNLGTGEVYLLYGETPPERSALIKAVEDGGYTVKGFKQ